MPSAVAQLQSDARPRILVVDDQRDSLLLLERRLEKAGFDCLSCSDSREVLALLSKEPVDVIILDIVMPHIDGFELCKMIKAQEETRDIPVLFLTANLQSEDKVRGLNAGAHDYLSKPVDQAELVARARAALRAKRMHDGLKSQLRLQTELNRLQQQIVNDYWQKTFGQLAASLAHEINNPLAAAIGNVQIIAHHPQLDPTISERIRQVDLSLQRVGAKLRSLLLIAQEKNELERVNLASLLDDLITVVNYHLLVHKIVLATEFDRSVHWYGRCTDLARAIVYILYHNIDLCLTHSGKALHLKLAQEEGGGICLQVLSTGTPMTLEAQHLVFARNLSSEADPGLFLARQILSKLGGILEFARPPFPFTTEMRIHLS